MSDIKLNYGISGDIAVEELDIALDPGIRTAVLVSLFTDARISDTIEFEGDRRGYWGDVSDTEDKISTGSLLWTLQRERLTPKTVDLFKQYCKDALHWLISDEVADDITVQAEKSKVNQNAIIAEIVISKNRKNLLKYSFNWQAELK